MQDKIEAKWQKRWKEEKLFEPQVDVGREKFMITVPWPYTSGSLHVGHGRTYTIGDIIARYKRSRGYNVLFPMGFHESGTPVLAIAQKVRKGDQATLKQYRESLEQYGEKDLDSILDSFKEPSAIATYFSNAIIHDFTRMGYSIDWTRKFRSAEPMYQEFVKWQFQKLNSMGHITQGDYPLLYSIEDENPVGEDDIKDGDTDKVSIEEFTAVIFRTRDFSVVAASLRPETLYGVTNLWIADSGDYILADMDGEKIALSTEAFEKLQRQKPDIKFIQKMERKKLLSQKYTVPLTGKKVRMYESSLVNASTASGFAFSVPAHSVWDYVGLNDLGIKMDLEKLISMEDPEMNVESLISKFNIKSLEDRDALVQTTQVLYKEEYYSGTMTDAVPEFSGQPASRTRDEIKRKLLTNNEAFILYETSRDAETRSGSKVIVAVVKDQWFIDYSDRKWKDETHRLIDNMLFLPEYVQKAFHDSIEWLKQRPCARTRGLGTRLPFDDKWVIESLSDSTLYPAVYTNTPELRKLYEENGSLDPNLLNRIFLDRSDEKHSILEEKAKTERAYWYGVDLRITAPAHISNHLSFYLMNHVAVFDPKYYPGGILISGMVTSRGAKIGKSKGNYVSLVDVAEKYSADVYRLFVAVGADISTELEWNEPDVSTTSRKLEQFKQMLEDFHKEELELNYFEKWFLASFYAKYHSYMESMDKYSLRQGYVTIFHEVLNDLRYMETRGGRINAVLGEIMKPWLIALAPVIPHIAEEYWHRYVEDSFVSSAALPMVPRELLDQDVLKMQDFAENVLKDIREIIKATGIKPARIEIGIAPQQLFEFHSRMQADKRSEITPDLKPLIPDYMKNKKSIQDFGIDEFEALMKNAAVMKETFDCEVNVNIAEIREKGKNAWPGRPAIRLHQD